MDLDLTTPANQSRKVSRAERERTGLYAHLYLQLRDLVDNRGSQVRELSPIDCTRWLVAAELGSADAQLATFLRSLMFHVGAWAKMRIEQSATLKGWHLRNVQEMFDYTPAGMDIRPSVFTGDAYLHDKRGFYELCDRTDRERLKTFCMTGDSRLVRTTIGFDPMNVHVGKLAVVILHMEILYQTDINVKRLKGEDYTSWFGRICDALNGRAPRYSRDKFTSLPCKGQRR